VDADDGNIDGSGSQGRSYLSNFHNSQLLITFNASDLGGKLPTHAGIVWTDVGRNGGGDGPGSQPVLFSATDSLGNVLGPIGPHFLGDKYINGQTAEDRFFGVYNPSGISSITISMPGSNNWEVDHLQYGSEIEKQAPVSYPDLAPTQPSLHLTASALGKTLDSSPFEFHVPFNVGIDVSFKGYVTEGSNSAFYTGYRYHWIKDGVRQLSEKDQLTLRLSPQDKPYNVVLKVEKLDDTAQSTPPIYNPNPVNPTIDASIQVSIKKNDKWDCKGRLGQWCNDGDKTNHWVTTDMKPVPFCNEVREQICINSQMSVGAILHDKCCSKNLDGLGCRGNYKPDLNTSGCEKEWGQAIMDKLNGNLFDHKWIYRWIDPTNEKDTASEDIEDWWKKIADPGTIISYGEEEPDKETVQKICKSEKAEPRTSQIKFPGSYSGSTPAAIIGTKEKTIRIDPTTQGYLDVIATLRLNETTIWVCSAIIEWPKPLVSPQGKIDTFGKKITPAAKSKAKKDTRAGCNKSSNVFSPSTGGAEGELKKYGTGTDGCAQ